MSVTERPEDFVVQPPTGEYTHIEPFTAFEGKDSDRKCPLIILNTPLQKLDLRALWTHSSVQVCADGGANRLFEFFEDESERAKHIPTYITGDCDSLKDEVKSYYLQNGTIVIPQYCQYSSDFMKAIKVVLLHGSDAGAQALRGEIEEVKGLNGLVHQLVSSDPKTNPQKTVHVAGGIGGRFDQTFQSINQMYAMREEYPWLTLVFFSPQDVIFLVTKGVTYVTYSDRTVFNTKEKIPKCGLLPYGKKVVLNSCGLLYDVSDWPSEVGGAVSSSNGICGTNGFIIQTTDEVVMNVEISRKFFRGPRGFGK